jgi:predicted dehydrogenase
MNVSRRKFLGSTAAVVAAGTMAKGTVFGANDRIGVCVMGFHGQGGSHINDVLEQEGAEIVALCDVDERVLQMGARKVEREQGAEPARYTDIRDALADEQVDAITIAAPNHWHSLATYWAILAGKDVYVEKPLSHNIWEGRQIVKAAKKHGRIVQHGTQSRADSTLIRDMRLLHEGFIGKIVHSRGYVYKNGNRYAIGHGAPGDVPAYLDWNLWQGPRAESPYLINVDSDRKPGLQVHYNWHWFWKYGNGEIGNQGVHEMDIACWGHNRGLPVKSSSTGGRYAWDDDGETPNTQATQFTYEDGTMLTFEVRNLGSFHEADAGSCGNSFYGENGYYVRRKGFFDYNNEPIEVKEEKPKGEHKFTHFFNAVRSRKQEDCPMSVLDAHIGCAHIHIGNIAYRLGRTVFFDPEAETFRDNDEANAMVKDYYREGFEIKDVEA